MYRASELYRTGRLLRPLRAETVGYPGQTECSRQVAAPPPYDLDAARQWCKQTLHLPLTPTILLASCQRLQSEGVGVLLTGEGGDDWLAGRREHWPDLVRHRRWRQLLTEGIAWRPSVPLHRQLKTIAGRALGPLVSAQQRLSFSHKIPVWIDAGWARRIELQDRWQRDSLAVPLPSYAQKQRFQNYHSARRYVNWENILAFAGSHELELRHPFHDLRLTHFLMGADGAYLRHGDESKHLLREAMRGTLPETIRIREGKPNSSPSVVSALAEGFPSAARANCCR